MITKGRQSINLVENSSGMCGVMLLLLGCALWGFYPGFTDRQDRWPPSCLTPAGLVRGPVAGVA
jgi:hypothetical protein